MSVTTQEPFLHADQCESPAASNQTGDWVPMPGTKVHAARHRWVGRCRLEGSLAQACQITPLGKTGSTSLAPLPPLPVCSGCRFR